MFINSIHCTWNGKLWQLLLINNDFSFFPESNLVIKTHFYPVGNAIRMKATGEGTKNPKCSKCLKIALWMILSIILAAFEQKDKFHISFSYYVSLVVITGVKKLMFQLWALICQFAVSLAEMTFMFKISLSCFKEDHKHPRKKAWLVLVTTKYVHNIFLTQIKGKQNLVTNLSLRTPCIHCQENILIYYIYIVPLFCYELQLQLHQVKSLDTWHGRNCPLSWSGVFPLPMRGPRRPPATP